MGRDGRRDPGRDDCVGAILGFPSNTSGGLENDAGRTHGAGLLHERTRRELRRGLTRDRLTQRAGRETHGGTRRHRASSLLVEARRNALAYQHDARDIATIDCQN